MSSGATRTEPTKPPARRVLPRSLAWRVLIPAGLAMLLITAITSLAMYSL
jgi:hypothetical protein